MCLLYLIINKTQVQIEKKKDKYGIEYSPASASDGACTRGWGGHAENGVPHLRFSTLTTGSVNRRLKVTEHGATGSKCLQCLDC